MSVSFMWEVIKPSKANSFGAGTSSDIDTLKETFGESVCADQIPMLQAMHKATGRDRSLWGEMANTIERLSAADPAVTIRVWTEF